MQEIKRGKRALPFIHQGGASRRVDSVIDADRNAVTKNSYIEGGGAIQKRKTADIFRRRRRLFREVPHENDQPGDYLQPFNSKGITMTLRALRLVGALAITAAVAGCVTTSQVANIAQNKLAYLQSNFTLDHVPGSFAQAPAGTSVELHFQRLVVKNDVSTTKVGNSQVEHYVGEVTLLNAGNGWIEQMIEWSSNDIPYAIDYSLNFMGMFSVRTQHVDLNAARPGVMWTLGNITALDRGITNPKENAEYHFAGTGDNKNYSADCKTDKYYDASGILPTLSGQALKMVCTYSADGIVQSKGFFVYLAQYGTYIAIGHSTSSVTVDYKITAITSE